MDVTVLVKYVPDTQAPRRVDGPGWRLDRGGAAGLLSELDEHAVEAAVSLVEADGGSVTAVTMGPKQADVAVRRALQMGADSGVHILDEALAGSDTVATSLVLATVVAALRPRLLLTGMASTDAGTGTVPAMIAERLGWPQLTFADRLDMIGDGVRIRRDRGWCVEVIEAGLPAVVGVTDRANEPRYPSFRSIMAARTKRITAMDLAQLGIQPNEVGLLGARTAVDRVTVRPSRRTKNIIVDAGDAGIRLAEYLAEADLI